MPVSLLYLIFCLIFKFIYYLNHWMNVRLMKYLHSDRKHCLFCPITTCLLMVWSCQPIRFCVFAAFHCFVASVPTSTDSLLFFQLLQCFYSEVSLQAADFLSVFLFFSLCLHYLLVCLYVAFLNIWKENLRFESLIWQSVTQDMFIDLCLLIRKQFWFWRVHFLPF